ncbi:hypothetical protein BJ508DRAFT_175999 [Ascobolus immersus RN42]|uniref:Uncharacterized protein n=1 Tax=Ascobolus immersus RN42 TaxID=1160509 RepID=A0A3N4HT75_ASCIM|nr:hypothetical protein BJ508DRAFT_175999 [Ascobolus immersus RN42]
MFCVVLGHIGGCTHRIYCARQGTECRICHDRGGICRPIHIFHHVSDRWLLAVQADYPGRQNSTYIPMHTIHATTGGHLTVPSISEVRQKSAREGLLFYECERAWRWTWSITVAVMVPLVSVVVVLSYRNMTLASEVQY